MANKAKAVGPIITFVFEVIMTPIHCLVCALATGAGAIVATTQTAGQTGSEAATQVAGSAGVAMMYIGTWGGSAFMLLGAISLLVGSILVFSGKNEGAVTCAGFSRFAGWFLFLIAAYILVTCGIMTGTVIGYCACLPTFIAALFMLKSGKTLRKSATE